MDMFAKKYRKAYEAERRYQDAPRSGWADPKGRKSADNQTIEIRRKEAADMAADLASALYGSYFRLYENQALRNYMDQLAKDEPDAVECSECYFRYLPDWMDGKCPYCAAKAAAKEKVREMLKEPEESRPETGAAG